MISVKRRGATREAQATTQNVKAAPSFLVARKALYEILKQYCFGKVVEGLDIIDQIRQGDVIEKIIVHEA